MQISYLEKIVDVDSKDMRALKELANAYEKNKMKAKALDVYKMYIELVKEPSEYKIIKDKIEKLENLGASDAQESEGLIDKIMKLFHK